MNRFTHELLRTRLEGNGLILMRNFFPRDPLTLFREAASRCFDAIESGTHVPGHYKYIPQAHSVQLTVLLDFGIEDAGTLMAPLQVEGMGAIFSSLLAGGRWRCRLEHSWARKKFAPRHAPRSGYHIQDWHQDGALGAQFPLEPGPEIAPTRLATCWIPLSACGNDSPGLEFIRQPQPALLHFTELNDAALRRRFAADAFWAPALEFGDGLVFRNDVLHRTHVNEKMGGDRISVEYRVFPEDS